MAVSSTELAWAAGFFDGEGCTYINNKCTRISVTQYEPTTLERFGNAVGIPRVRGPYGDREMYQWYAGGKKAQAVMDQLWPYLSEPKKAQYLEKKGALQ